MGTIAPHRNSEIKMVLGGRKPMATIEHDKDPDQYCMAVCLMNAGMLSGRVRPTVDCPMGEIAFAKPGAWRTLDSYEDLLRTGVERFGLKEYHRKMGKLFGYADEDIEAFINAEINCDCIKCKGA